MERDARNHNGEFTMKAMTALLAAVLGALVACSDPERLQGPAAPSRPALRVVSDGPSRITFAQLTCGAGSGPVRNAGCDDQGWWGWAADLSTLLEGTTGWTNGTPGTNGGADHTPVWSPDGARIAFERNGEIMVLRISYSTTANLTNDPAFDSDPAWSPDGARIAFASNRAGSSDLYAMGADGSNVQRITTDVGFIGRPSWSPDGTRIAFECMIDSGNTDICTVNADGSQLVRLTSDPAADMAPEWSPSGDRIAFSTGRFAGGGQLALMNADGSDVSALGSGIFGSNPAWSPDGQRVAFDYSDVNDEFCLRSCVYIVNADGTGLIFLWAEGMSPAWAPEGYVPPPPPPPPAPDLRPIAQFSLSCSHLVCQFADESTDDHGIIRRVWTFGDGTTAINVTNPSHSYAAVGTYEVTLTVMDGSGQTQTVTHTATAVDSPPVASFTSSCVGLTCTFADASTDDQAIASRSWDFGDGATATGLTPVHTYAAGGTFSVTLTVTDNAGQSASLTNTVMAVDLPPVARFSVSCRGTVCTLDGRSSTDDRGIVSYAWSLGKHPDGSATGAVVTTDYRKAGSYTVTLTVRDALGQANTVTQTIVVTKTGGL